MERKVKIQVTAETEQFGAGVRKAAGDLDKLAHAADRLAMVRKIREGLGSGASSLLGGMGVSLGVTAIAAGIGAAARSTANYAGRIADLRDKLGVSAAAFQEFDYAAAQSGASLDDVASAIKLMQINQVQALAGGKAEIAAFQGLGISLQQLKSLKPEELFRQIAQNAQQGVAGPQQMADMVAVLGRGADALLPAFRNGFAAAGEEAKKAGAIMDESLINKLDSVGDRMDGLAKRLRAGMGMVMDWLLNRFTDLQASIGYVAAFAGAKFGGASWKEARQAASDAFDATYAADAQDRAAKPLVTAVEVPKKEAPAEKEKKAAKVIEQAAAMPQADALARIGLFRGGSSGMDAAMRDQVSKLESIRTELQKLNRAVDR